jgi:acetylornithine deacetylase/succinyl-diaminopimelate desuccinylase-like protein
MAIFRCKAFLLLWAMAAAGADRDPVDWRSLNAETLRHFSALLKIDTSNPPGHETPAAEYLQNVLRQEGIAVKLLAHDPSRANLVARIPASTPGNHARPILILGHTDVVGVDRAKWSVDPFAAVRKGGFIYGRGAVDDKVHVAAGLMVMLLLQRQHIHLDRDVIFVAEAGEEGSTNVGIDFLIKEHWNEIAAEYALAEGGSAMAQNGRVRYVTITTAEKTPHGVWLIARGPSGHASRPILSNAVTHVAEAVAKAAAWRTPVRLNETTRAYFERLAAVSSSEDSGRYRHVGDPARGPEIDRYFEQYEPSLYAMLHTTVTPTILKAGFRFNVIPSTANAYLDIRALPDEDMALFLNQLRATINDPAVEIVPRPVMRPATPPSRLDTAMFHALEAAQRRLFPEAVMLPAMLTGATDMAQLRARGVQAYGFGPIVEAGDSGGEAHADNERIAEQSLYKVVQYLWYTILAVAAS